MGGFAWLQVIMFKKSFASIFSAKLRPHPEAKQPIRGSTPPTTNWEYDDQEADHTGAPLPCVDDSWEQPLLAMCMHACNAMPPQ